jgi:hypothetical protein|tara:strand:- start:43 stop:243 length:201 start_codon:yes stop_codon:yes gene_type:complete
MGMREISGRWTFSEGIGLSPDQQMEPCDSGEMLLMRNHVSQLMLKYEQQVCHRMEGFSQLVPASVW